MLGLLALQELKIACNSTQTKLVTVWSLVVILKKRNLYSNIYSSAVICPLDSCYITVNHMFL